MILKTSHALLAALALVAGPAFAQDTAETPSPADAATTQEAQPETETTAPAASDEATAPAEDTAAPADSPEAQPESDAAASAEGEEASDEPRTGSYYARSTHGEWTVRCIKTDGKVDPCEMYQLISDENDNAVAEITLIPLRNGDVAAGATLIAPLETDLMQGLGFGVDNAEPRGYPFSFCAPVGCVSRMGFTPDELNAMKRGNKVTVTLLPFGSDPKDPVRLDLSLTGFTAAFAEVEQIADEAGDAAPKVLEESNSPAE